MPRTHRSAGGGWAGLERLLTTSDQLAQALADDPSARDLPAISREYR